MPGLRPRLISLNIMALYFSSPFLLTAKEMVERKLRRGYPPTHPLERPQLGPMPQAPSLPPLPAHSFANPRPPLKRMCLPAGRQEGAHYLYSAHPQPLKIQCLVIEIWKLGFVWKLGFGYWNFFFWGLTPPKQLTLHNRSYAPNVEENELFFVV